MAGRLLTIFARPRKWSSQESGRDGKTQRTKLERRKSARREVTRPSFGALAFLRQIILWFFSSLKANSHNQRVCFDTFSA